MRFFITFLFGLFVQVALIGQVTDLKGTDFWFTFNEEFENNYEQKLKVLISSYTQGTTITIDIPSEDVTITDVLSANFAKEYDLPNTLSKELIGGVILDKSVHISASSPISVVAIQHRRGIGDATTILPSNVLGKSYYIHAQESYNTDLLPGGGRASVCAITDNTVVSITPAVDLEGGFLADTSFSLTLNAGQTIEFRALNLEEDLSGTDIRACQPIAVFSGAQAVANPPSIFDEYCCADRLWTQAHPVESWGTKFFTVPFLYTNPSYIGKYSLKIIASKNGTIVKGNGNVITELQRGEAYYVEERQGNNIIEANHPISLAQIMYSNDYIHDQTQDETGDPSIFVIPAADQMTTKAVFNTFDDLSWKNFNTFYCTLITTANATPFFGINYPYTVEWKPFNADSTYVYGTFLLDEDAYTYAITNQAGFQGYVYFLGGDVSYIHNLNFSINLDEYPNISESWQLPEQACINEAITFEVADFISADYTHLHWDFGDGTQAIGNPIEHTYLSSGTYEVRLDLRIDNCETKTFTQTLDVIGTPTNDLVINGASQVLPFDTLTYFIPTISTSTYEWNIEGGTIIEDFRDSVHVVWNNQEEMGSISVIEQTQEGCIGASDDMTISIQLLTPSEGTCLAGMTSFPNPVSNELQLQLGATVAGNYTLEIVNSIGQVVDKQTIMIDAGSNQLLLDISQLSAGVYFARVTDGTCVSLLRWVKVSE